MEFSGPEYWSGQPFPSPGDLPNPTKAGLKPCLYPVLDPGEAESFHQDPRPIPSNFYLEPLEMSPCLTTPTFSDGSVVKSLPANAGDTGDVGSIPQGRKWQPTPVFLPGKSYGQSMGGHSPWGRKELDTTKREHKRATLMFQPAQAPRLAQLEGRFLFLFLFWLHGMWDLNSPTKDPTHTPCSGRKFGLSIAGSPGKLKEVSNPVCPSPYVTDLRTMGPKRQDDQFFVAETGGHTGVLNPGPLLTVALTEPARTALCTCWTEFSQAGTLSLQTCPATFPEPFCWPFHRHCSLPFCSLKAPQFLSLLFFL